MKIKKNIFYLFCVIDITGISLLFFAWKIGIAVIVIGTMLQMLFIKKNKQKADSKNCPKCKSVIPEKARICPECGFSYNNGVKEGELLDVITREQYEIEKLTSEEIDCDFEKIEEIAVEEITSFEGDIAEFFEERDRKDEVLGVD